MRDTETGRFVKEKQGVHWGLGAIEEEDSIPSPRSFEFDRAYLLTTRDRWHAMAMIAEKDLNKQCNHNLIFGLITGAISAWLVLVVL